MKTSMVRAANTITSMIIHILTPKIIRKITIIDTDTSMITDMATVMVTVVTGTAMDMVMEATMAMIMRT